jgi:MFS family permease
MHERTLRRNVVGMLLFELTWGLGIPFGLFVPMVPAYLTSMGASKALMGFVQSLWTILIPLQLLGGHFFTGPGRLRAAMALYMSATGIRLLCDVLSLFVPGMWTPQVLTAAFIVACAGYVSLLVVGQSVYMGVLTDNIPRQKRGLVFGLRTLCMGTGGVAMGFAASWVLHRWPSPLNYRVSFMVGDALWTASSLCLLLLRDTPAPGSRQAGPPGFLRALAGKVRHVLANPNYRIFLFFHMLNIVGLTAAAFIVPYAKEKLGVQDGLLAWLSVIFLASGAALGFLMGRLADRVGYRSVGAVQSLLLLVFFLVALRSRSFTAVCVAYALYSIVNITAPFMLVNMSVELCPGMGVSDLTALGGTFLLPFVALSSPLAGTLIDRTGTYVTVFAIGAAVAVIALLGFALLVREPRTGRLLELKQIQMR